MGKAPSGLRNPFRRQHSHLEFFPQAPARSMPKLWMALSTKILIISMIRINPGLLAKISQVFTVFQQLFLSPDVLSGA